ncbi:hypothetical protein [Pseudonocardia zijingensis]|jgi:hypothetical protein|uniref:Copper resistance protein D domain-containing protein n=1 Tax=Pseudonocardia zijingensis TaxID=153376 RepID=A0ABN1PAM6_9PSEU
MSDLAGVARLAVVAHLALAAVWLGSMVYSLAVVQPRVDRFFPDPERREEFLLALAQGNRRPVVALIAALLLTDLVVLLFRPELRLGYTIALVAYLLAGALFVHVSWRHWPARVFALPEELPGFQRRLRRIAWTMTALVGAAFLTTSVASVG